ncbi:hypothetical protein ACRCPS_17910 [Pseudomonas aeruginosa]
MQLVKFPRTGVVARVVGAVYSAQISYSRAELHDRDEESLKDDLSMAISGTYGVVNQNLSIVGASNDLASPVVLIQVDFSLDGKPFSAATLPVLVDVDEAVDYFAKAYAWSDAEQVHAYQGQEVRSTIEIKLPALNGRELRTGSTPDGVPYVRVVQFGFELYYATCPAPAIDSASMGALAALLSAGLPEHQPALAVN